jgi:hypothetical protein
MEAINDLRAQRSQDANWSACIRTLHPRIRAYLARMPCSTDEAEIIEQDLIGRLILEGIDLPSSASPWDVLLPLLRDECRKQSATWRREVRLGDVSSVRATDSGDELAEFQPVMFQLATAGYRHYDRAFA